MAPTLSVVALGTVHRHHLELAAAAGSSIFGLETVIDPPLAIPHYAFNPTRGQYNANAIVRKLGQSHLRPGRDAIVGIGLIDLFEPEVEYVLGDGDAGQHAAVIGIHRLEQTGGHQQLNQRLRTLAMWAIGHAIGLRDCDDARCLMKASHAAVDLDSRSSNLCLPCRNVLVPARVG